MPNFRGPFPPKKLEKMFLTKDPLLLKAIQLVLGEGVAVIGHHYRCREDIYSLLMAWGLEMGHTVEEVRKVLQRIIPGEYLLNLESLLEWAVPGWGFNLAEGIPEENEELRARHSRIQFLHHCEEARVRFKDDAKRGWEGLIIFV